MRKEEERSGEDLARRDEKRMRREADSRIKKGGMRERKAITEWRCGRGGRIRRVWAAGRVI